MLGYVVFLFSHSFITRWSDAPVSDQSVSLILNEEEEEACHEKKY